MNRKNIFGFAGILAMLCGLIFLILPKQSMEIYNLHVDDHGAFLTRYMGLWMLGVGLIVWGMRKVETVKAAARTTMIGGIAVTLLGLIVSVWDMLFFSNPYLWINVALYGTPLILLVYLYFKKEA